MAQKKLTIPKPCSENWDLMPAMGDGRHCSKCDHIIVDFSEFSDRELVQMLQKGKYHCGRFAGDQLNKVYNFPVTQRRNKHYWMAIAVSLVAGMFQLAPLNAQTPMTTRRYESHELKFKPDPNNRQNDVQNDQEEVEGDTKIELGLIIKKAGSMTPLSNVHIEIEGYDISVKTDENGMATMEMDSLLDPNTKVSVYIHAYGYKSRTVKIRISQLMKMKRVVFLNRKRHKRRGGHFMGVVAYPDF